jgi:hypothetical protein
MAPTFHTRGMSRGSVSTRILVGAIGLVAYAALLALYLVPFIVSAREGEFVSTLNAQVALLVLPVGVLPTLVLAGLLLVGRFTRSALIAAGIWMLVNAFLWLPVHFALAAWAGAVGALLLVGALVRWPTAQVGSTRSRPQR